MADHKLVFKNTLLLYVRVFLSMAIGLYTSRIVLRELGVDDFGIYSVVASLSLLFAYLNYGVSSSLQRFMSCEIATDNTPGLQKCFSTSLLAGICLGGILIMLAETIGLWALSEVIDIPAGREADTMFVFQISIFILVIELFKTCCQSLIIAEEKMSFFAYVSVAESLLKLLMVFLLSWSSGEKLRVYALLLAGVCTVVLACHIVYCRISFPAIRFTLRDSRERLREIFAFTGWNTLASFSDLCYMQGTNIVLNVFYGVAYNATMGITNQVKSALYSFSKNLQTAANPHLTKEFARGDYRSFSQLAIMISVISCLLLYLFGLPILLNTDLILNTWLTTVPPDGAVFIRLIIVFCLVDSLVGPLWVGMQAFGQIRNYQIVMSAGWLMSLPVMWLVLRLGGAPSCVLLVQIVFNTLLLAVRLWFAVRFCHISFREYAVNVICRLLTAMIVAGALPTAICLGTEGLVRFLASTGATLLTVPLCTLFIAFPPSQRKTIINFIRTKIPHGRH